MHTVFWPMLPQAPRTTLPQHSWAEMSVSAPVLRTQHFQSSAKWLVPTLPPPPQPHPNSHTLPQPQSQSLAPVTLAQLPPPTSASLVPRRLKTSPTQAFASGAVTCNTADASTFGCLASADWSTFNNKVSSSSLSQIFPFTPTTNYGVNTSATSTPLWARAALFASSTSQFDQINVGSTTLSTLATSTFFR